MVWQLTKNSRMRNFSTVEPCNKAQPRLQLLALRAYINSNVQHRRLLVDISAVHF